jgi:fluoride exporter
VTELVGAVLVVLGGFCGGALRFFVSGLVGRRFGETYPWGTLAVNVSGAFIVGALFGLAPSVGGIADHVWFRDLVIIGLLGGYTTVSSFSLQTLNLALDGQAPRAWLNVISSAGLCIVAITLGFFAAALLA